MLWAVRLCVEHREIPGQGTFEHHELYDKHPVEITHASTRDPVYAPRVFFPVPEAYVDRFSRWYGVRLSAHGI